MYCSHLLNDCYLGEGRDLLDVFMYLILTLWIIFYPCLCHHHFKHRKVSSLFICNIIILYIQTNDNFLSKMLESQFIQKYFYHILCNQYSFSNNVTHRSSTFFFILDTYFIIISKSEKTTTNWMKRTRTRVRGNKIILYTKKSKSEKHTFLYNCNTLEETYLCEHYFCNYTNRMKIYLLTL